LEEGTGSYREEGARRKGMKAAAGWLSLDE